MALLSWKVKCENETLRQTNVFIVLKTSTAAFVSVVTTASNITNFMPVYHNFDSYKKELTSFMTC